MVKESIYFQEMEKGTLTSLVRLGVNAQPDIVLVAMLIRGEYENVFSYGQHGSTFGGNPVGCASGKAVLEEIFNNGLLNSVAKLDSYLLTELNGFAKLFPSK